MTDAIVDTTVLTDALLKPSVRDQTMTALATFKTRLPAYALKELREGPLGNFVWAHNKLVVDGSMAGFYGSLAAMSRTPRRYTTSTAIESLREAASKSRAEFRTLGKLVARYGEEADPDKVEADRLQIALRGLILKAWARRRRLADQVVGELACFAEDGPKVDSAGIITFPSPPCSKEKPCAMAEIMRTDLDRSRRILDAVAKHAPEKTETSRREAALRVICRKRAPPVPHETCRSIGDAAFAFLCPNGGVILTTNTRDHEPLAAAVGAQVVTPAEAAKT